MTLQTILLVDDDTDLLQVVRQRCRKIGLNVQQARNLLTATAMIDKAVPDIVCVDVEMPTGNGLRFCETLSADPRTAQVPIIVLTGRKDAETIQKCEQIGAHYAFKSADIWATLDPLIGRLLPESPREQPQSTTAVRLRNMSAHSIPPWPGETDAENAQNGKARHVIVADDDHDLVQFLSARFSSLGCSVIGVNTSLDAINAIHHMQPDMVILDVNMPSGSGLSVCEMMATDERLRLVPVIILTGCSDEQTIRRCHDMLVFYVQKGANIWSRIDPLVREMLHLGDLRPPMETAMEKLIADELVARKNPQSKPEAAGGGQAEQLLDAVFEILGVEGEAAAGENDARAADPCDLVTMPWVLCIDDDFDFSDALKLRFDNCGVAVARAVDGMAGFRMAFSTPACAILLDYQMPNGQGDYILSRLKDNPVTRDIPVFMITGVKDKMLERRVIAMGAAGYLLKPVDFESLRIRLAEYISALAKPAVQLAVAEG